MPKKYAAPGKKVVEVIPYEGGFHLYRNGLPYKIKGIGVLDATYLRQAKENGANAVRLYSTDNAKEILDSADKLGLTVMLGLHLPYAAIEMDYRDQKAVALQIELVRKEVLKYKDHPALLMWGIGNELGLYLKGTPNLQRMPLLQTIEKIAAMIHEIDPNHPTATTLPFTSIDAIAETDRFCKSLDVIALNSFEELDKLPAQAGKYSKHYIISEYGARGYWRSAFTDWSSRIEHTSQERSLFVLAQNKVIQSDPARCLGAYAFIWGYKLEYSPTWFSLYTAQGDATQVVDALHYIWTGQWPAEQSPSIYSITVNNQKSADNIYLQPGKQFTAGITTAGSEAAGLYVTGHIQKDGLEVVQLLAQTGYKQQESTRHDADSIPLQTEYDTVNENGNRCNRISLTFQAPAEPGPYRLFIYLHNHQKKVATANACFYVHE